MKLLPSEQEQIVKERLPELLKAVEEGKFIYISEPCDCGALIRHNNGGNYHYRATIVKDSGKYYVMEWSTCELIPPGEWEETTIEEITGMIKDALKEGWRVEIE